MPDPDKGQGFRKRVLLLKIACLSLLLVSCLSKTPSVQIHDPSSSQALLQTNSEVNQARTANATLSPTPLASITSTKTSSPTVKAVLPSRTPAPTMSPVTEPLIGVEILRLVPTSFERLNETGVKMIRRNGLLWSEVEPVQGERNWAAVANLEQDLALLGSRGYQIILVVRSTPGWAQKVKGYSCGPVNEKGLKAFARFMQDVVTRYSVPPYRIKYWELGNEPDVDPALVPPDSTMGCWGDQASEYYGGEYYARLLKEVYPVIKAADPQAQVLIGGLLVDCDPTHPPEGSDCKASKFLEGILRAGGGNFFDILSFHGYPAYVGGHDLDENSPAWNARGGAVLGRVSYLREVMAAYGIDKPLMHTESSLVCPEWNAEKCNPPGDEFFEAQADYLVTLFVRNWAAGIAGTIWYQFEGPGWRHVGLLDAAGAPKPAYRALQFLTQELEGARFIGQVDQFRSVRAYSFSTAEKRIWVLWSSDSQPDTITLPEGIQQVFDKYGNPVQWQGNTLDVMGPIYLELSP